MPTAHAQQTSDPIVSRLLDAAFMQAATKRPARHQQWVTLSFQLGGELPNSLLMASVQDAGHLDLLLCALEDESASGAERPMMSFHQQKMLSEAFVGTCYEILRTLKQRDRESLGDSARPRSAAFYSLFTDLELVRVALDKHELPKDDSLKVPLQMVRTPASGEARDNYVYDPDDSRRAHIMPTGVTATGSVCWHVIALKDNGNSYWVERQDMANRMLGLLRPK